MKWLLKWTHERKYIESKIGLFDTLENAQQSVRDWWSKNNYEPPYVRQKGDTNTSTVVTWDYGNHYTFYEFVRVPNDFVIDYVELKYQQFHDGKYIIRDIVFDDMLPITINDNGSIKVDSVSLAKMRTPIHESCLKGLCKALNDILDEYRSKLKTREIEAKTSVVKTMGFN